MDTDLLWASPSHLKPIEILLGVSEPVSRLQELYFRTCLGVSVGAAANKIIK